MTSREQSSNHLLSSDAETDKFISWPFLFYYLTCMYGAMVVIFAGWSLSRKLDNRSPGNISLHSALGLQKFMAHSLDVSDAEWETNRAMTIPLLLTLTPFVAVSRGIGLWNRSWLRKGYYTVAGLLFAGFVHGAFVFIVLGAAALNFALSHVIAGTSLGRSGIWTLNLSSLLLSQIVPVRSTEFRLQALTDLWPSRYPWRMTFALCTLRMISYSLDLHAQKMSYESPDSETKLKPKSRKGSSNDLRRAQSHDFSSTGAGLYIAYVFYPPLYLVGPIQTLSDFSSQLHKPPNVPFRKVFDYGAWTFLLTGVVELFCRSIYMTSVLKSGLWERTGKLLGFDLRGADLLAIAALNLVFIYLKFCVVWRFSRFWALLDNFNPPENDDQSILYVYSFQEFLRHWNASLHQWLLMYVYKPTGGNTSMLKSSLAVFLLIAVVLGSGPLNVVCAFLATALLASEQAVRDWLEQLKQNKTVSPGVVRHLQAVASSMCIICLFTLALVLTVLKEQTLKFLLALSNFPLQIGAACVGMFALSHILLAIAHRSRS